MDYNIFSYIGSYLQEISIKQSYEASSMSLSNVQDGSYIVYKPSSLKPSSLKPSSLKPSSLKQSSLKPLTINNALTIKYNFNIFDYIKKIRHECYQKYNKQLSNAMRIGYLNGYRDALSNTQSYKIKNL
jgi:hypothetical protein